MSSPLSVFLAGATVVFEGLAWTPPAPTRVDLANGIPVILVEDHEVPLVELTVWSRTGWAHVDEDEQGVVDIYGEALLTGGTKARAPSELDEEFGRRTVSANAGVEAEETSVTVLALAEEWEAAASLMAEVLWRPRFDAARVQVQVGRAEELEKRQAVDPVERARRELARAVYGERHPYARSTSVDAIRRVRPKHLLRFHEAAFRPERMVISVAGDVHPERARTVLEEAFGGWRGRRAGARPAPTRDQAGPEVPPPSGRLGVRWVATEVVQATLALGGVGPGRRDADRDAFRVLNELLGGRGGSRLFMELRARRGLAYTAGSRLLPRTGGGLWIASTRTKAVTAVEAALRMREVIRGVREAVLPEDEVAAAREALAHAAVFNFETPGRVARAYADALLYGLPEDAPRTIAARIAAVTAEDVARVARTYLAEDRLALVIVGDAARTERRPEELGAVETIPEKP